MATRSDLEWVLLNVGSAVRGPPPPPPIPPRRMAASQLAPQRPPGSPTAVRVTLHSPAAGQTLSVGVDGDGGCTVHRYGPIGGACGTCAGGSQPAVGGGAPGGASPGAGCKADWRQHFRATMQAFDERHANLQAELSTLRREALSS